MGKGSRRNKALLWATLFAGGATLLRKYGTHALMGDDERFNWSDLAVALAAGTISYVMFRNRYDDDFNIT